MRYLNYINGKWKEPTTGEYRENLSPHDGENLGEFPSSAAADLHDAVAAAKNSFPDWKKLSFQQRASYLQKAADILKKNIQEVGQDLIKEEGKTFLEGMGEAPIGLPAYLNIMLLKPGSQSGK